MNVGQQKTIDELVTKIEKLLATSIPQQWRTQHSIENEKVQAQAIGILTQLRYDTTGMKWTIEPDSTVERACQDMMLINACLTALDNGKAPPLHSYRPQLKAARALLADALANELHIRPHSSDIRETVVIDAIQTMTHQPAWPTPRR